MLGMITVLDESIMNITKALEKNGMLDDTIIVFTSDVFSFFYLYEESIAF